MFVITADQRGSRTSADAVDETLAALTLRAGDRLALPADRTAGDEIQALTRDAACALDLALALRRDGRWHIGVGIGAVRRPLPGNTRSATGDAFVAARDAVTAAKASPQGLALRAEPDEAVATDPPLNPAHAEASLLLLVALRDRRSDAGWAVCDLLERGDSQAEIAERLGITPQAVSLRARTAQWRLEQAATPAVVTLLAMCDRHLDPEAP